jgi:uncharacterized membrane protein YfcA
MDLLLLLSAGLAAGFIGGLIGVGGGIIFAPVLFFFFQSQGVDAAVVPALTIGSSLFCTLVVALASAWFQYRKQAVVPRVALGVGLSSAVAVFLMTRFVTTQPWYNGTVFQLVFGGLLLVIVGRMLLSKQDPPGDVQEAGPPNLPFAFLAGTGTAAGVVSSATGVGGGVVLVPAYNNLLGLSIHTAVGTSSATIVLIALVGVLNYVAAGWGNPAVPGTALGFVDFGHAAILSLPAVFTARLGVWTAHRFNRRRLRQSFAVLALLVAVRLLLNAL